MFSGCGKNVSHYDILPGVAKERKKEPVMLMCKLIVGLLAVLGLNLLILYAS